MDPAPTPRPPDDPHAAFAHAVVQAGTALQDGSTRRGRRAHRKATGEPGGARNMASLARRSASHAGAGAVASGAWLAEVALEAAARTPVRDLATLRQHHHGLAGSLLAGSLIRSSSRLTAGVGAGTGALAAVSYATPGTMGGLAIELAAETLIVVAVEMKMVGELHEAAGISLPEGYRAKGPIIAKSWADSRGVRPEVISGLALLQTSAIGGAASELLGRSARDQLVMQLRKHLMRRTRRGMASLAPMFIGAGAGAYINRKATRRLGTSIATSLGIPPPPR